MKQLITLVTIGIAFASLFGKNGPKGKPKLAPDPGPLCETCGDLGEVMEMVCYGGPPHEIWKYCPDCDCDPERGPECYS